MDGFLNFGVVQSNPYLEISLERERLWLYADWIGYQTVASVQEGCEAILSLMIEYSAYNIINDNTQVQGIWAGAAVWVAQDWFPRMQQAGLQRFAWIYSPTRFSRISTDTTLAELGETAPYIRVFDGKADAISWLEELDTRTKRLAEWITKAEAVGAPKNVIAAVISNNWNPIRAWREARGMSQAFVAARLSMSQIEYAAREAVTVSPGELQLQILSSLFDVPVAVLNLEGESDAPPSIMRKIDSI